MSEKIMIYATGRTGSNYLHNTIYNNLDVDYFTCPIRPRKLFKENVDIHSSLESSITAMEAHTRSIIWKTHPDPLVNPKLLVNYESYIDRFCQIPTHIIGLTRKDLIQSTLSRIIARTTESWTPPYQHNKISVLPSTVIRFCNVTLHHSLYEFARNRHNLKINTMIYYEDLQFNDTDITLLGLDHIGPTNQDTVKIIHEKTPDKKAIMDNYNQVEDMISEYYRDVSLDWINISDGKITDIELKF
jgi:hypothetical protein